MIFPNIQNVAKALIIFPRLSLGWNSVKYENITGMLPPTLHSKTTKGSTIYQNSYNAKQKTTHTHSKKPQEFCKSMQLVISLV
jgi:hypothetical protein